MKKNLIYSAINSLLLTILTFSPIFLMSQQTITGSIMHDGMDREYVLYVPAIYSSEQAVPLILNFHGYTSNAIEQMVYGNFWSIADTANFIVVHPQGSLLNGITHWNVGGWTIGSTVDDVGFTNALIDELSGLYNIDQERIYSTGMSNGGYMSFLLACQLSDKIAAIASVTGSMTPETYNDCNPQHPTPIMQIHGTTDAVVPYNGALWSKSIADVLQYWVGYNNCNPEADVIPVADLNTGDGSTVEYYLHDGGDRDITTEHFKVTGGGHTWPGNAIGGAGTNYDIDASQEIWKFFSRYDINGVRDITSSINAPLTQEIALKIYPNPVQNIVNIERMDGEDLRYQIYSKMGQKLMEGTLSSQTNQINISSLSSDVYFLMIANNNFKILKMD